MNYGVTFPMFSKVDVNGDAAHPLHSLPRSSGGGAIAD
jgi:glutathione peroxidase